MPKLKGNEEKLSVQTFSRLVITGRGASLDEDSISSEKLTRLLAYMVCHSKQEIPIAELCETLWPDEGDSDNPAGALKNLMYRLRTLLKKTWGDVSYIKTGQRSYSWDADVPLELDCDTFDECCKQANLEGDPNNRIALLQDAMDLYSGEFLPKQNTEFWVASQGTYYHVEYISAAQNLIDLYNQQAKYKEVAQVATNALKIDPLDEDLHNSLIRALSAQNQTKLAMEHYQQAVDLLYESLGTAPSDELRATYEELLKQTNEQEMDINIIADELKEDNGGGAFLCEYGVFKRTFHLEKRRASRLGISEYLSLITVLPTVDFAKDSPAYLDTINIAMDHLQDVLMESLRSGDIVSRYSGSQFVVLLPTCQYETGKMVMERIEKSFFKDTTRKWRVRLAFSLDEIELG